ncbi:MAG: signal peptidase I [Dehalococcoidia bacterium]|jgi:signal peptidase I
MKIATKITILEVVGALLVALLLFLGVHFTLESRQVDGTSMLPNLESGQRVLVCKAAYWFGDPQRGDVVVFHDSSRPSPTDYIIHRIVGLPNEKVEIRNGQVYIDDSMLEEPYIQGNSLNRPPEIVPHDSYLIVGDNRNSASADIVPRNEIIGKAWLCYWPLSNWRLIRGHSYH